MSSSIKLTNSSGKIVTITNPDTTSADVTVDLLNNAYTIATVDDFGTVPVGYTTVIVTDTDRGGIFVWSASGTANGGTVFAGATGYWNRQYSGAVNVKWFGAVGDGLTDDTTAIQTALSVANTDKKVLFIPQNTYKISDTLSWHQATHSIISDGATLLFADTVTGACIEFADLTKTATYGNCNFRMDNLIIVAPNSSLNVDIIKSMTTSSAPQANILFDKVTFVGGRYQVVFGSNSTFLWFRNCKFTSLSDAYFQTETAIYFDASASTNSGEQLVFDTCQFNNIHTVVENTQTDIAGGLTFNSCGLDYVVRFVYATHVTRFKFNSCWFETYRYSTNWFYNNKKGGVIYMNDCEMWLTEVNTDTIDNYIFNSGEDAKIIIKDLFIHKLATFNSSIKHLADPTALGKITCDGLSSYDVTIPAVFLANNYFPYKLGAANALDYFVKQADESAAVTITSSTDSIIGTNGSVKISSSTVRNIMHRKIRLNVNSSTNKRLFFNLGYKLVGFVASSASLNILIYDDYDNQVASISTGTSLTKDGNWYTLQKLFQDDIPKFSYIIVDIYANAHSASDSATRDLYIGELTLNYI